MPMHTLTAFFDSRDHAETALARLREVGILDSNLSVSPQAQPGAASGATQGPETQEPETGFWAFLREIFGAAPEYPSYREGLRRGGIMVVAHVDEARLDRACGILDEHGSVDLDARERQWREEGWRGEPTAASVGAQTFSSELDGGSAIAAAAAGLTRQQGSPARAPGERAEAPEMLSAEDVGAPALNRGRVRIHSSVFQSLRMREGLGGAQAGVSGLSENMEVLGADGQHVGVIDHIEGASIELKKDDPAAHGEHHWIPLEWVASVDTAARLKLSSTDAWSQWTAA